MGKHQPETRSKKISDVKNSLSSLVNEVSRNETRVLVVKRGVPVAAIDSADDLARLDGLDRERAESFKVIDELREAFKDVPAEEIERETDRIIARIRSEEQEHVLEATGS